MKQALITAAALSLTGISLSACGGEAPVEDAAAEQGIPGLRITNGRMVLNAVEGNPAAVYFDLAYDADRGLAVRRADVEGAESALIHEYGDNRGVREMMEALPTALKQGTELAFEPGSRHVMAMGVSPELEVGDTTQVTLTVSGGSTITFPATVQAPGTGDD